MVTLNHLLTYLTLRIREGVKWGSGHVRAPHSRFRANLEQPSAPNKRLAIVYRFSVTMGPDDVIFCVFWQLKMSVDLMEFQAKIAIEEWGVGIM